MTDELRKKIGVVCKQLGDIELQVVYLLSSRLLGGQATYGILTKERILAGKWFGESREENADSGIYLQLELIKQSLLREPLVEPEQKP